MANFYPAGTIDHFVIFRPPGTIPAGNYGSTLSAGSAVYLGTAVLAPEVEVRPAFIDIKSDIGGRSVPTQKVYDGEQAIINTTLNRFNWGVYKSLFTTTVVPGGVGPAVSTDGALNRGSLVLGSQDYELVLRYNFGGTVVAPVDFPVGRKYYSCITLGARESTVGTRVMEVSLVIEANGILNPLTRAFSLYSELSADVLSGLPPAN